MQQQIDWKENSPGLETLIWHKKVRGMRNIKPQGTVRISCMQRIVVENAIRIVVENAIRIVVENAFRIVVENAIRIVVENRIKIFPAYRIMNGCYARYAQLQQIENK